MGELREVRERIALVDKHTPSPEKRAELIYKHIRSSDQFSNWDLICFCVWYLATQSAVYPWLEKLVRPLSNMMNTAHYMLGEEIGIYALPREPAQAAQESKGVDVRALFEKGYGPK